MDLIWEKREGDYFCKRDWTASLSDLPGGHQFLLFPPPCGEGGLL